MSKESLAQSRSNEKLVQGLEAIKHQPFDPARQEEAKLLKQK